MADPNKGHQGKPKPKAGQVLPASPENNPARGGQRATGWHSEGPGRSTRGPVGGTDQSDRAYHLPKGYITTPSGRLSSAPRGGGRGTVGKANAFLSFEVTSSSIRETLVSLAAELTASADGALAGLLAEARRIQQRAKTNVRPYHYEGRLEDAIQVRVSIKNTSSFVRVTVGIHGRTFAPEGATFERGWHSEKGLMPPSEPIAFWAMRRGLAKDQKEADRLGFVIARAQGRRGYSFDRRPWLSSAFEAERASVEPTVARYILSTWGAQARDSGGRFAARG